MVESKVADAREETEHNRSYDHDDGRIAQFSLGGPGGFFKLIDHLTEEYAGAAERVLH